MLVGTNTVAVDDPLLTVRDEHDQPLAAPAAARGDGGARPRRRPAGLRRRTPRRVHLRTRDPHEALAELFARDRQHVFLEGGPTLAAAFLAGRPGRRDRRLRRPDAARRRPAAPSPTSESPPSPTRSVPAVTDVTVLDGRRPDAQRPAHADPHGEEPLMFTGIVEELGTVAAVEDQGDAIRLTIRADHRARGRRARRLDLRQRLLPDGRRRATATPGPPTSCRRRSTRPACPASAPATGSTSSARSPPTTRLGGHIVQGHVDGVGTVVRRTPSEHWEVVEISLPAELAPLPRRQGLDHRRRRQPHRRRGRRRPASRSA